MDGRGGGVISDPKNYIADFVGFQAVYFGRKFWKKAQCNFQKGGERGRVIANPKNFIANLCILTNFLEKTQCNFQKPYYIMSPKNEIAPFSLCPTWFLKIVPPSGHYPQQKNSPAFLFTQKSVKMRPSTEQYISCFLYNGSI